MSSIQVDQNEVVVDDNDTMTNLVKKDDEIYSKSSSIGVLSHGDSGDDEDGEEAQSKGLVEEGSLNSLAALEAALPFKRGLSGFYEGKSKTFMNLGDVKDIEDVEKEESPLNKRRRLTMATTLYKWGSSSSSSMPLLTPTDGENTHNVEVEQEFKSSTSSTSFNSVDSTTTTTKPSIN
ncbi:uncharacterized protein LOC107028214 [Solanum pennellii]|uniref:Uncharacterized protein LOC107028214 n=1 Tax=Solanum pennellii TaxID=28526 RepID=A0ABM1HFC1_SOLPN|nr:uncharacterized protein LOC107028214 [Solanum pennellii]